MWLWGDGTIGYTFKSQSGPKIFEVTVLGLAWVWLHCQSCLEINGSIITNNSSKSNYK